jgi:hypothetical protein
MPRMVLGWILRFAAENKLAEQRGITVTPAEAQKALNAEKAQVASSGATLEEAAVASGLPPDMLPQLGTYVQIEIDFGNQLDNGKVPTSTTARAALTVKINHLVCLAAKSMNIKVNPQYGVYDYKQLTVVAKPTTLSAPSPAPSATKIQSTPKC